MLFAFSLFKPEPPPPPAGPGEYIFILIVIAAILGLGWLFLTNATFRGQVMDAHRASQARKAARWDAAKRVLGSYLKSKGS
jgi:hypothetical protein